MGKYVQKKSGQRRSLSDALDQAEHDHYMDCPNAEFGIRVAALLLDAILLFIFISSFQRISGALHQSVFSHLSDRSFFYLRVAEVAFQGMVVYSILFYALFQFGGTPGKLMLGLRVINSETGDTLSIWLAVFREGIVKPSLFICTCGIAFLSPLFRDDKLALHDIFTGTCVKRIHTK